MEVRGEVRSLEERFPHGRTSRVSQWLAGAPRFDMQYAARWLAQPCPMMVAVARSDERGRGWARVVVDCCAGSASSNLEQQPDHGPLRAGVLRRYCFVLNFDVELEVPGGLRRSDDHAVRRQCDTVGES